MFLAAMPLAVLGLWDRNFRRGSLVLAAATLLGPLGLVVAAVQGS
jgi:hypothetical protein